MTTELVHYVSLLDDIKGRIRRAQMRATLSANREMLELYWDVGRLIQARQDVEGWGAAVIPRLSRDLRNALPDVRGFSERNLKRMIRFYREYPSLLKEVPPTVALSAGTKNHEEVPPTVAQPPSMHEPAPPPIADAVLGLPWGHNFVLIEKIKDQQVRHWYMLQTLTAGWSRDVLAMMIKSRVHERAGSATTNFGQRLPPAQSDLAKQALKDPYIFDFLTLDKPFRERELEAGLVAHIERFLLELGVGFAFVGRQYHIAVGEDDFYLDLLFYHLKLRCFVVIDLKIGAFKPDFAGKMNFYLNVVDDTLRHEHDGPSIGMILCQDKKRILAEYALRGMDKPIGVSEYDLTRALPAAFESSLPSIDELEAELANEVSDEH